MADLVQRTKDQDIAIITINNPPVNALSPGVREGISDALDQIVQDANIKAAVLIGGGRTFVVGADIKEFGELLEGRPAAATTCRAGQDFRGFWQGRRSGGVGILPLD